MPIWIKCIFMFWICFAIMHIFAMIYSEEIRRKLILVKLPGGKCPWYLYIYGLSFLACIFSLIPLGIWFIFLR